MIERFGSAMRFLHKLPIRLRSFSSAADGNASRSPEAAFTAAAIESLLRDTGPTVAALRQRPKETTCLQGYRLLRQRWRQVLQSCDRPLLPRLAGGDEFRNILDAGFKDIEPLPTEVSFHEALPLLLEQTLEHPDEHLRHLLTAMLYYQPYQLGSRHVWRHFRGADPRLDATFFRYAFAMSYNYAVLGEAEEHVRFVEESLGRLNDLATDTNGTVRPGRPSILELFEQFYPAAMRACNSSSLKELIILERRFLKLLLEERWQGKKAAPLAARPRTNGKLRVGLLRHDYTGELEFLLPALARLPSERYELHIFACGDAGREAMAARYPGFHSHPLDQTNPFASLNRVREQAIDILINGTSLPGNFAGLRSVLLLARAAPIQAMYCSDIMTSGIDAVDYFILGEVYRRDGIEAEFTERVVAIPGIGYCFPRQRSLFPVRRTVRSELDLADDEVVYVSQAHLYKITPEMLASWLRILKGNRRSRLVLMPVSTDYMKPYVRRLERAIQAASGKTGVSADAIRILDTQGTKAVSRILAGADIYLDCFPYSGPTSTVEALLVGLPVVTRAGTTFRSRFAAGVLEAISLGDCVTRTEDEYVMLARQLGASADRRLEIQQRIEANLPGARFFQPELVARDLDALLSQLARLPAPGGSALI